jgi:iron(III) transport system permease protein
VLAAVLLGLTLIAFWAAAALAGARVVRHGQRQGRRRRCRRTCRAACGRTCFGIAARGSLFTLVCYAVILTGGFVQRHRPRRHDADVPHLRGGFGAEWGSRGLFFSGSAWDSLFNTIEVAAIAAPLTALVGLLSAYVITRHRFAAGARSSS